jgi:hypothetical protein
MVDYQAVYDELTHAVVVISCFDPATPFAHSCNGGGSTRWVQSVSTDLGLSFTAPQPISGTLGAYQGVQPGAGLGLQLRR